MTTSITAEVCRICHLPREGHNFRHPFTPEDEGAMLGKVIESSTDQAKRPVAEGRVRNAIGGDPVLRMMMIRKGFVTPQELTDLEEELRSAGAIFYDPDSVGQSGGS